MNPNELLQPAPISCPCLSKTLNEATDANNQDLETILNRNDADALYLNNDSKLEESLTTPLELKFIIHFLFEKAF